MSNRLAASTSPYLLQHKDNPVDWWEWGEDAFAEARRRDVPVLLSVGYAACHWCHVMAHESFEDEATAAEMNAGFVNVKVDREERPDVDAVYMEATQALTGQGGWPMTVFLTPDGRVFHAGTYYPPQPRHGMPSFRQLLAAVGDAWRERPGEVRAAGERIASALDERDQPTGEQPPAADDLAAAVGRLAGDYDAVRGGFGGAPKFPPSTVLLWLVRHAGRVGPRGSGGEALRMAEGTLLSMARSGTYDQVEGGFARYAVDAGWVVPHFEKMLYDNALLARTYLHWWRLTGHPTGRRVALETCEWMLRRLGTHQGGLASSLDADTPDGEGHGVEGATYVWTPAQLTDLLGDADGPWAADLLGVTPEGTFEHGTSTLRLLRDLDDPRVDTADVARWQEVRRQLAQAREARAQPGRDDKVVAAWNGLAVAALAETGALLDRPDLVAAGRRVAGLLLDVHTAQEPGGGLRLRRVSRDGVAGKPAGVLEDHGDVAEGLLALHAVTGGRRWLDAAGALLGTALERFCDKETGAWHDTADDATDPALLGPGGRRRAADLTEGPHPNGIGAVAGALLTWSALTGEATAAGAAERALAELAAVARAAPRFAGWGLAVAEALADGPRQVAVVAPAHDAGGEALHLAALRGTAPGLVVARGEPGAEHPGLLVGRGLVDGQAAAYPCVGMLCELPLTDPAALAGWTREEW